MFGKPFAEHSILNMRSNHSKDLNNEQISKNFVVCNCRIISNNCSLPDDNESFYTNRLHPSSNTHNAAVSGIT